MTLALFVVALSVAYLGVEAAAGAWCRRRAWRRRAWAVEACRRRG